MGILAKTAEERNQYFDKVITGLDNATIS